MKNYKYRANVLKTEFKRSKKERERDAWYMRRRRQEIKDGIRIPTPSDLRTKTQNPHYQRDYQRKARELVIKQYGGKCICCGETKKEFLAIDHINGNGNTHRKEKGARNIATYLIKNKYPIGFQILCHNCNMAKGIYGQCPHLIKILTK